MPEANPYAAPQETPQHDPLPAGQDRSLKWLLFSFEGRARRSEYWKGVLLVYGAILATALLLSLISEATGDGVFVALIALALPAFWALLAVQIKRWHDRNKSGFWVFIGVVPYIGGIWQFVECGCLEGTPGPNSYGDDPKGRAF